MDKFSVILSPRAAKDLDGFSDAVCGRIARALNALRDNPFPRGKLIKKIKGKDSDFYRLRADKHRVFYIIEAGRVVVLRIVGKKEAERMIRGLN